MESMATMVLTEIWEYFRNFTVLTELIKVTGKAVEDKVKG